MSLLALLVINSIIIPIQFLVWFLPKAVMVLGTATAVIFFWPVIILMAPALLSPEKKR